jgi:hypothetical protein
VIYNEEQESIRFALSSFRRKALTQFMGEFVQILNDEGYSFEDLLNALANYMYTSDLVEYVPILEKLIDSLQNLKNNTGANHE